MALEVGSRIAHYNVTALIGEGGMGEVYRARDAKLDRDVALNVLPPELTRDNEACTCFTREAQAASALDHPNICTIPTSAPSTRSTRRTTASSISSWRTTKGRRSRNGSLVGRMSWKNFNVIDEERRASWNT